MGYFDALDDGLFLGRDGAPGAVLYSKQDLTPAQREQARANIGAEESGGGATVTEADVSGWGFIKEVPPVVSSVTLDSSCTLSGGTVCGGTVCGSTLCGCTFGNCGTIGDGMIYGGTIESSTIQYGIICGSTICSGTICGGTINEVSITVGSQDGFYAGKLSLVDSPSGALSGGSGTFRKMVCGADVSSALSGFYIPAFAT